MAGVLDSIPQYFFYWQLNNFIFWLMIWTVLVIVKSLTPRQKKWLIFLGSIKSFLPPVLIPISTLSSFWPGVSPEYYYPEIIVEFSKPGTTSISLMFGWLLAGSLLILLFVFKLIKLKRFKDELREETYWVDGHEIVVYVAPDNTGPGLLGFFSPKIIVPSDFNRWKAEHQKLALYHERVHLKNKDYLIHAIKPFMLIINVLNPFVWHVMRLLEQNVEILADEEVMIFSGKTADDYYRNILEISKQYLLPERVYAVQFSMAASYKLLRARLLFFKTMKERFMMNNKKMLVFIMVPFILLMFYMACSTDHVEAPEGKNIMDSKATSSMFDDVAFKELDEKPVCSNLESISENYPQKFRESGIEGRVVIRLHIMKDGTVGKVDIVKDELNIPPTAQYSLSEAENEVIHRAQKLKWKPGFLNGKPVNTSLVMPIAFRLK